MIFNIIKKKLFNILSFITGGSSSPVIYVILIAIILTSNSIWFSVNANKNSKIKQLKLEIISLLNEKEKKNITLNILQNNFNSFQIEVSKKMKIKEELSVEREKSLQNQIDTILKESKTRTDLIQKDFKDNLGKYCVALFNDLVYTNNQIGDTIIKDNNNYINDIKNTNN